MKNALIILLLTLSTISSAKNYYIKSTGKDSNTGLSDAQAWQTIIKVNSSSSIFASGDSILLNRGETFYGTISILKSGTAGHPIVIGAYGIGNDPIITGFTTITGWTNEGGGIYSKVITCQSALNLVTVDGINTAMGRYPNTGWLNYESHNTNLSITDNQLTSTPNWTGAEAVIFKRLWMIDRNVITNHSATKLTYTTGSIWEPTDGFGYFIQNDIKTLDAFGEWYYNGTKFYMYFGAVDPATKTVKIATLDKLIDVVYPYTTIKNIHFTGSNSHTIYLDTQGGDIVVQNCTIDFSGGTAIRVSQGSWDKITNFTISSNTINNVNELAIEIRSSTNNRGTINNNIITNVGLLKGGGSENDNWGDGIAVIAKDVVVEYNSVTNVGHSGIRFNNSDNVVVRNNFVNNFALTRYDAGGIYAWNDGTFFYNYDFNTSTKNKFENNIVLNGNSKSEGIGGSTDLSVWGVYLDEFCINIEVIGNTAVNCPTAGFFYLCPVSNITAYNNTFFNNGIGLQLLEWAAKLIRGCSITNNVFISKDAGQLSLNFMSSYGDFGQIGTADNNYYARPIDDVNTFFTYDPSTGSKYKTLAGWQSLSGLDLNSHKSPITITNVNDLRFEYNATKMNKEIALDKPMIDVKGSKYISSITLLPYTSVVLMVDPNPAQPVIPVFTGAVVENSIPTIIEMSYHINLANIVPSASAFTVQVNGVNRVINSVVVSGNKVQLTLASAVVFGNAVTVSYTTPATNPLQTTSGDKAESINAKTVTNNCLSTIPVYVSSEIGNTTPGILEISYDLNMANIVPAISAFTVVVNSVNRAVTTVAISGSKIQLTLASPVVYGNIVSVSYTTPTINQLQSVSGGLATSFNAKPVTNSCISPAPVYISSVVENATPTLVGITFSLSLDNKATPASSFDVQVNSVSRTVNSVAIVGGKVQLTLASAVLFGDIVTVAYTIPASNPLQTVSGGQAESFSAKSVTNNCISSNPTYFNSVIENATPSRLEITFTLDLANIVPATSSFNVQVNTISRTVNLIEIAGSKVRLSLSSPVAYGDIVTVAYTSPASFQLQTISGILAPSFSTKTVTNNCLPTLPVYISSAVENTTPSILEMTYNVNLANIVPSPTAFNVQVNSVNRGVISVTIVGAKVRLTMASTVVYGDIVTVGYLAPAINPLQVISGGLAASLSGKSVTNNCAAPSPNYVSSVIENNAPALLVITYDLNLANIIPTTSAFNIQVNSVTRSVNSVSIIGNNARLTLASAVTYGDFVTVAYTRPSSNQLQSVSGGLAVTFSAKPVTNNCILTIPVYVNSVIENATPSILEMSYDMALANIIPPTSAFNVRVNSLSRSVNSVSIAGSKVHLTLTNTVGYGDIVTVSYISPAINPLQVASGGKAANISSQSVINNCAAVIPIYINSVIENITPTVLEMVFDLPLLNSAPPTSAFNIQVNSDYVDVNSITMLGDKIRLTLARAIVYGDIVHISYTKPSINAIRTNSGGYAENIIYQPVLNNCIDLNRPNDPPVLIIKNETDCYSGFVYELDASGSYDPDNDVLTYEWTIPNNIAVSSTNSSKIKFLSPIVKISQAIEFHLKVSDGRTNQSTSIPINILPYRPELATARIANIEASDYQAPDNPKNVIDGNLSTNWSVVGENQWIILKMAVPYKISHLQLAFLKGQKYESYFDIYASQDEIIWKPILTTVASCNFSGDFQVFDFPGSETSTEYLYIKFVGQGNSLNKLNTISEFKIFGNLQQNPGNENTEKGNIIIYPNPAQDYFNISIEGPNLEPDKIRIIDFSGNIVFEDLLVPGIKNIQVPNNFSTGVYVVELRSGNLILDAQKLIINR
jgi:uncharacterized repeat protein (TIGR02059 family)